MKDKYEVIVGNIGTVYNGNNKREAQLVYTTYVDRSKSGRGRCAGESVYLMANGDPIQEHQGPADDMEAV